MERATSRGARPRLVVAFPSLSGGGGGGEERRGRRGKRPVAGLRGLQREAGALSGSDDGGGRFRRREAPSPLPLLPPAAAAAAAALLPGRHYRDAHGHARLVDDLDGRCRGGGRRGGGLEGIAQALTSSPSLPGTGGEARGPDRGARGAHCGRGRRELEDVERARRDGEGRRRRRGRRTPSDGFVISSSSEVAGGADLEAPRRVDGGLPPAGRGRVGVGGERGRDPGAEGARGDRRRRRRTGFVVFSVCSSCLDLEQQAPQSRLGERRAAASCSRPRRGLEQRRDKADREPRPQAGQGLRLRLRWKRNRFRRRGI